MNTNPVVKPSNPTTKTPRTPHTSRTRPPPPISNPMHPPVPFTYLPGSSTNALNSPTILS